MRLDIASVRGQQMNQISLPEPVQFARKLYNSNSLDAIHIISTSTIHQVLYIKNRFGGIGDWSGSQGACCINFTNLSMSIYKDTVDRFLIKRMELISTKNREKQPSPIYNQAYIFQTVLN